METRGHAFCSRSDVEVALHAYEEWGESFVERLEGMFALALWDASSRTLVAARDRAGEKPLYYTQTSRRLILASEIKALLACPDVSREVDLDALDQFLTYEYVIAPRTIFSAVRRLPAAHYMVYRNGTLTVKRYWDAATVTPKAWNEDDAAAALRQTLQRAVARQTMSDVPLGAFLSGGLDSSAVVAMMAKSSGQDGTTVNTFSMGFADGSYNELPHARRVAARFHTHHHEGMVEPDVADLFHRLIVHLDEPFADVSVFPTFLVSQIARTHVTVALSGDGGDELFGGYDTYDADRLARRISAVFPRPAVSALEALASLLPPSERKKGLVNKLKRFMTGLAGAPSEIGHYRWMTYLSSAAKQELYTPALRAALAGSDVYRPIRDALRSANTDDLLNRQLYTDLSVYLADDILVKVDRMSMATSLETRAPFLDIDVMELAFSMPGHLKIRRGMRKYILKRAMMDTLPRSILHRSKEGFSIPMKNWLKRELAPLMRDLLSPERIARRGWVEPPCGRDSNRPASCRARESRSRTVQPDGTGTVGAGPRRLSSGELILSAQICDFSLRSLGGPSKLRRNDSRGSGDRIVPGVTCRAGLGAPKQYIRKPHRHFLPYGVPNFAYRDAAATAECSPFFCRTNELVEHQAVPRAVGKGQPPARGGRKLAVRRRSGSAQEGIHVRHVATDQRRCVGPARVHTSIELVDSDVDGAFSGLPSRRVAHAQHADQSVDSVPAMIGHHAPGLQSHSVTARRRRQQPPMNQPDIGRLQRQRWKRYVHAVEKGVDLASLESQPDRRPSRADHGWCRRSRTHAREPRTGICRRPDRLPRARPAKAMQSRSSSPWTGARTTARRFLALDAR